MIRIAHGRFKGRQLKIKYNTKPRPTLSICRESLFNIIGSRIENCVFLDVFAGSGAVGIEASSRGAKEVIFIEQDTLLAKSLQKNISLLGIEKASILQGHYRLNLKKLKKYKNQIDFIFLDPPYGFEYAKEPFLQILKHQLLSSDGVVIVERGERDVYYDKEFLEQICFQKVDERQYGVSVLEWFVKSLK